MKYFWIKQTNLILPVVIFLLVFQVYAEGETLPAEKELENRWGALLNVFPTKRNFKTPHGHQLLDKPSLDAKSIKIVREPTLNAAACMQRNGINYYISDYSWDRIDSREPIWVVILNEDLKPLISENGEVPPEVVFEDRWGGELKIYEKEKFVSFEQGYNIYQISQGDSNPVNSSPVSGGLTAVGELRRNGETYFVSNWSWDLWTKEGKEPYWVRKVEPSHTDKLGESPHRTPGFHLRRSPGASPDHYRKQWLVVAGLDGYDKAKDLDFAWKDAVEFHALLVSEFGFDAENTVVLSSKKGKPSEVAETVPGAIGWQSNGNKAAFEKVFGTGEDSYGWLWDNGIHQDDLLIFFFAGHGKSDSNNEGFLIASDSDPENLEGGSCIAVSWIKDRIDALPCRHKAIILDSCYSGKLFSKATRMGSQPSAKINGGRSGGTIIPNSVSTPELALKMDKSLSQYYMYPAFLGLSAGRETPVVDGKGNGHSVFTAMLLQAFRERASSERNDHAFSFQTVARIVEERVRDRSGILQIPLSGSLQDSNSGDNTGDIYFRPTRKRRTPLEERQYQLALQSTRSAMSEMTLGHYDVAGAFLASSLRTYPTRAAKIRLLSLLTEENWPFPFPEKFLESFDGIGGYHTIFSGNSPDEWDQSKRGIPLKSPTDGLPFLPPFFVANRDGELDSWGFGFSPALRLIGLEGEDGEKKLYNISGRPVQRVWQKYRTESDHHQGPAILLRKGPDDEYDPSEWEDVKKFENGLGMDDEQLYQKHVVIVLPGANQAVVDAGKSGGVEIWNYIENTRDRKLVMVKEGTDSKSFMVSLLELSGCGRMLFGGCYDSEVCGWKTSDWKKIMHYGDFLAADRRSSLSNHAIPGPSMGHLQYEEKRPVPYVNPSLFALNKSEDLLLGMQWKDQIKKELQIQVWDLHTGMSLTKGLPMPQIEGKPLSMRFSDDESKILCFFKNGDCFALPWLFGLSPNENPPEWFVDLAENLLGWSVSVTGEVASVNEPGNQLRLLRNTVSRHKNQQWKRIGEWLMASRDSRGNAPISPLNNKTLTNDETETFYIPSKLDPDFWQSVYNKLQKKGGNSEIIESRLSEIEEAIEISKGNEDSLPLETAILAIMHGQEKKARDTLKSIDPSWTETELLVRLLIDDGSLESFENAQQAIDKLGFDDEYDDYSLQFLLWKAQDKTHLIREKLESFEGDQREWYYYRFPEYRASSSSH